MIWVKRAWVVVIFLFYFNPGNLFCQSFSRDFNRILKEYHNKGIDTIIAYSLSPVDNNFYVYHKKNGKDFLSKIFFQKSNSYKKITKEISSDHIFSIYMGNKESIDSALIIGDELFYKTTRIDNNTVLVRGSISHGKSQFFYIQVYKTTFTYRFCCGNSINNEYWMKARGLWMLISAINNQRTEIGW